MLGVWRGTLPAAAEGSSTVNVEPSFSPCALGRNGSTMQFDQMLHDRQPQSEAAVFSRRGCVGLAEAFEDMLEEIPVDADAVVADDDGDVRTFPPHARSERFRRAA